MFRITSALTVVLLTPLAGAAQTLEGTWRLIEHEIRRPNAPVNVIRLDGASPPLLVFTDEHAISINPRGSDASPEGEFAELSFSYGAAIARYEQDGITLSYRPVLFPPIALGSLGSGTEVPVQALADSGLLSERQVVNLTEGLLETVGTDERGVTTVLRYVRVAGQ